MGNGEAKELTCMTHGHELGGGMIVGGWYRADGNGGETKMDNCNSIINKIHFLRKEFRVENIFLSELQRYYSTIFWSKMYKQNFISVLFTASKTKN